MTTRFERSAQSVKDAYEALSSARTFADARRSWEDFLSRWRRALNHCDEAGRSAQARKYVSSYKRVSAVPALAYLWAARNADEHGLAEITGHQESAIAIGALGGYREEVGEPDTDGRVTVRLIPEVDDPPPFIVFMPERIKLRPVTNRGTVFPVPSGYDYELGETPAPVALAMIGLEFLFAEIANLRGSTDGGMG